MPPTPLVPAGSAVSPVAGEGLTFATLAPVTILMPPAPTPPTPGPMARLRAALGWAAVVYAAALHASTGPAPQPTSTPAAKPDSAPAHRTAPVVAPHPPARGEPAATASAPPRIVLHWGEP